VLCKNLYLDDYSGSRMRSLCNLVPRSRGCAKPKDLGTRDLGRRLEPVVGSW